MHRQIAGTLTGRVTKWIVLVFWIIAFVGHGHVRRQAGRRPEQRGVLVAARRAPSRPRRSRSSSRSRTPTPSRPSSSTSATAGLTEADLAAASRERRASSRRWTASRARSCGPHPVRGRSGRPDARHLQLRQERLEGHARHRRRRCATSPRSTGSTSTSRAPAARPPTRPRRSRASTAACCWRRSAWSSSSCCSPTAARSCGCCRSSRVVRRAGHVPGAGLLPREVRRPHRQRAEPGDPDASW